MAPTTKLAAPPAAAAAAGRRFDLARYRDLSLLPVLLVLGVIGFAVSPAFLTSDNLLGVGQQATELSLLVLGEALILISGRMDLSLESTIGVAPVIAVWLVLPDHGARFNGIGLFPGWTAIPLCLAVGALIGAINGFLILKLRLNGFIVTLGALTLLRGLQVAISQGQSIVNLPGSFSYLGSASWFGAPAAIWICALLFAVGSAALAWLRHGRALYAIGGNAEAARAAGIRVDRITWTVLILGGVLAAFAGDPLHRPLRLHLRRPGQRLDLPGLRRHRHRRGQPQRRSRYPLRRPHRRADTATGGQRDDPGRCTAAVEPVPQRRDHHHRPDHLPLRLRREAGVTEGQAR